MTDLTLVIANRNYSSWSLRPWVLLTHLGIPFKEVRLALDTPEFAANIGRYSPSRRVPALIDGDVTVWESLAILEYVSELAGGRGWPADRAARAVARAIASEMHAGFGPLRSAWPMNIRARNRRVPMTTELAASITRIDELWTTTRARFGTGGPWLFGAYSAADAMYLPIAFRLQTYGTERLGAAAREYVATSVGDPLVEPWVRASEAETETVAADEAGV